MPTGTTNSQRNRFRFIDALRGFSVVSMVLFHFCYDLKFIRGVDLDWFAPPLQDIWRASISWTFLAIAGCMCALSRNNAHRAARYGLLAFAIFAVTSIAQVDVPISFGIIYCMAACTMVEWLLEKLKLVPRGPVAALVLFAAFVGMLPLAHGRIGFGPVMLSIPRWFYDCGLFSWLGMPGPHFASGDYYPLLPYVLLFLSGTALGRWLKDVGYPAWWYDVGCKPLEFCGRHPLEIYVLHQPLLLAITQIL